MGRSFNWFNDIKVDERELNMWEYRNPIEYIGGDSCNHSPGHVIQLQDMFQQYGNTNIPYIDDWYEGTKEELISMLMPKDKVIEICDKFLNNPDETDPNDIREDIEWIKKLSEDGYYISYESL